MSEMSGFHVYTDTQKKIYLFAGKYNYYVNIYASNLNGWTTFLYSYSLINPLFTTSTSTLFSLLFYVLNRH